VRLWPSSLGSAGCGVRGAAWKTLLGLFSLPAHLFYLPASTWCVVAFPLPRLQAGGLAPSCRDCACATASLLLSACGISLPCINARGCILWGASACISFAGGRISFTTSAALCPLHIYTLRALHLHYPAWTTARWFRERQELRIAPLRRTQQLRRSRNAYFRPGRGFFSAPTVADITDGAYLGGVVLRLHLLRCCRSCSMVSSSVWRGGMLRARGSVLLNRQHTPALRAVRCLFCWIKRACATVRLTDDALSRATWLSAYWSIRISRRPLNAFVLVGLHPLPALPAAFAARGWWTFELSVGVDGRRCGAGMCCAATRVRASSAVPLVWRGCVSTCLPTVLRRSRACNRFRWFSFW